MSIGPPVGTSEAIQSGEGAMKSLMRSGAPVLTLSLGIAGAASVGGCTSVDYAQNQQRFQAGPGYSRGTGDAHVGDGSDPGYYTPAFSGGTDPARIGDGSDPGYLATQRYLQNTPGRGGGNG
jgi:hypothetical protein